MIYLVILGDWPLVIIYSLFWLAIYPIIELFLPLIPVQQKANDPVKSTEKDSESKSTQKHAQPKSSDTGLSNLDTLNDKETIINSVEKEDKYLNNTWYTNVKKYFSSRTLENTHLQLQK